MPFDTLIYEKQNGLARVTLNRPEVLNVYNTRMRDELWEVFCAIRDDPTVRAMLLNGAGRTFCAGADLTEFGTAPSVAVARTVRWARDVWGLLHDLEIPHHRGVAWLRHRFRAGDGVAVMPAWQPRARNSVSPS